MMYDPSQQHRGVKSHAMVEYVDIYPTLVERAIGAQAIPSGLDGKSFATLLDQPEAGMASILCDLHIALYLSIATRRRQADGVFSIPLPVPGQLHGQGGYHQAGEAAAKKEQKGGNRKGKEKQEE